MFALKTLLMTTAILTMGFAGSSHAASLLSSTNGLAVHSPVASVGADTNVNSGITRNDYQGHNAAGVNADGSLNGRTTETSTTTGENDTISTRQRIQSGNGSSATTNTQLDADVGTKVYNDESARNKQMQEDMDNNNGIHAGANVRTGSARGFNE